MAWEPVTLKNSDSRDALGSQKRTQPPPKTPLDENSLSQSINSIPTVGHEPSALPALPLAVALAVAIHSQGASCTCMYLYGLRELILMSRRSI